jgi:hypothetical protein
MGKPSQSRQAKFGEKGESKKNSKDAPLIHFIHPKVQKYALKLHLMSLKLRVFQYNSFIQSSKIYKNHFFPSEC